MWIAVLQVLIPLTLIAMLALRPARGVPGLALQIAATGLVLLALWRGVLWGVPPFRVWQGLVALWVVAAVLAVVRRRPGRSGWLVPALNGALALVAGGFAALVLWEAPRAPAIDLAPPLAPGAYLVAGGGGTLAMNPHLRTLDASVPRYADWRGQSLGLDVLGQGDWGLSGPLMADPDPAAYAIFGAGIVAPCDGAVVAAQDGVADMAVPRMDRANMLGNHVILDCQGIWVVLAHFRQGSVKVKTGDAVTVGDPLGQVGNSGNTSQPHLHIHVQTPAKSAAAISGDPLPFTIDGRVLRRNDRWRP